MKFDVVIGNPPFQNNNDSRNADDSIYNEFMERAYKLGKKVMLVTPGRFLFNAGNTPKEWNEKMLNDEHLKVVRYEPKSKVFFPETDIKGGVAITYRDEDIKFGKIGTFIIFEELKSIFNKIYPHLENGSLENMFYLQNKFNLDVLYKDKPNLKQVIGNNGKEKRLVSSCFNLVDIFSSERTSEQDISILGIVKGNIRKYNWVDRKYIADNGNLNKYKVIIPNSNGSGSLGESLSTPLIGTPLIGYTQSFIGLGSFDTLLEAESALKYIKSKFCRVLLGILKVTQSNTPDKWKYVPLQDFTENSDIDWSQSVSEIDKQLYKKYELSEEEIEFIERNVKSMEDKVV